MVRVIGRIDLANEVHRALAEAGVESYVATEGPMTAALSAAKEGSEADVLVSFPPALEVCAAIKQTARHRPLVVVTDARHERHVRATVRYASGPDAHVVWPSSGEGLRTAIARAIAAAGTVRPRFRRGQLATPALATVFLLSGFAPYFRDSRPATFALNALGFGFMGAHYLIEATFAPSPLLYRLIGGLMALAAAMQAAILLFGR